MLWLQPCAYCLQCEPVTLQPLAVCVIQISVQSKKNNFTKSILHNTFSTIHFSQKYNTGYGYVGLRLNAVAKGSKLFRFRTLHPFSTNSLDMTNASGDMHKLFFEFLVLTVLRFLYAVVSCANSRVVVRCTTIAVVLILLSF